MSENTEPKEDKRKIYLLESDECPPCDELKEQLKEEIEAGRVQVIDITSDEALELLEKAGAGDQVEFPSALVVDSKGVRHCQIYHSKDITLSKCGDEIIAIREAGEPAKASPEPQEQPVSPGR